jgi:hypothetical protein
MDIDTQCLADFNFIFLSNPALSPYGRTNNTIKPRVQFTFVIYIRLPSTAILILRTVL